MWSSPRREVGNVTQKNSWRTATRNYDSRRPQIWLLCDSKHLVARNVAVFGHKIYVPGLRRENYGHISYENIFWTLFLNT